MNIPTRPTLHIGHFMTIRPILKHLSISLCLSCITTSLFASPAKLSSVKELMQMSQIDYLLKESINELTPYYDQQAEQIISNITGIKTLGPKEKEAAKKLGLLLKDSSNQLISSPKTTQALQDIYLKTYTEEEIQANLKFLKTPEGQSITRKNVQIMGQISEYMMELGQQTFNDPKARDHMQEEMLKIIAPLMKDKEKS